MTARLTITRNEPDDMQDRVVKLWVDGESWGRLAYGRCESRDVAPGPHVIEAISSLIRGKLARTWIV